MKYFKKENVFPYEAFVQTSIEKYFEYQGYALDNEGQVDLIAVKESDRWIVEAKGISEAIGTDFNTCIGQLVKSMVSDESKYAIAIPKHPKYKRQCLLLSSYFRELVQLYILVVDDNGEVQIIKPSMTIDDMSFSC